MLEKLRSLQVDRLLDLDECMVLMAFARSLHAEYLEQVGEVPEWLVRAGETLTAEIDKRLRADRLRALKEVEAELESLKEKPERRADAKRRLAKLQGLLGVGAPAKAGK